MTLWNPALPADSSKIRLSAGYIRGNEAAVQSVLTSGNLTNGYPYIPNTTPVYLYADVAPSGWTLYGSVSDCLLAIKGGSSQYNATGGTGSTVGTWSGPSYILQIADIPSHNHDVTYAFTDTGTTFIGAGTGTTSTKTTSSTGGGGGHQHDWTSTRPMAALGILCTKNP